MKVFGREPPCFHRRSLDDQTPQPKQIRERPAKQDDEQRQAPQLHMLQQRGPIAAARRRVVVATVVVLLPGVADPSELLRVVGDDAVDAAPDAPAHVSRLVDRPGQHHAPLLRRRGRVVHGLDELVAQRRHQGWVEDVEGEVRNGLEEVPRREDVDGDHRDGIAGEVFFAEGDVVGLLGVRKRSSLSLWA